MYAHKVPSSYLDAWHNKEGKSSVYFFSKSKNDFLDKCKNTDNVFGKTNYYYLRLFVDAPYENTDGGVSGSQMWMTDLLLKAFPDFFDKCDKKFSSYHFYLNSHELIEHKIFYFIRNYFCCDEDKVKVFRNDGTPVNAERLKNQIQAFWDSNDAREILEKKLSGVETNFSKTQKEIVSALNNNDPESIARLHNRVAELCAFQQSRIPLNVVTKKSIDCTLDLINGKLIEEGRPDLIQSYCERDYKDICQAQLLNYFIETKLFDFLEGDGKKSIVDSYVQVHQNASYFYLKANSHKFVIGDDPIVSIQFCNKPIFLAFPISPDYCLLILRCNEKIFDTTLSPDTNLIDFINYIMFKSSETGIISSDKKFKSNERILDEKRVCDLFAKIGFVIG